MAKNWGESAGDAFTQAMDTSMKLKAEREKYFMENDPDTIAAKAEATMRGYLSAGGLGDTNTADPTKGFGTVLTGIAGGKPRFTNDDPIKQYERASVLRKEFIDRPEVKDYLTVYTQVNSMDALLKGALSGNQKNKISLDQGLITMYNKITDPTSVVRESEYARTPENIPFLNRFSGAMKKIDEGGAGLTDKDREALVWGAKVIADQRGRTYNETLKSYDELARNQAMVDPKNVLRSYEPHKNYIGEVNDFSSMSDDELRRIASGK